MGREGSTRRLARVTGTLLHKFLFVIIVVLQVDHGDDVFGTSTFVQSLFFVLTLRSTLFHEDGNIFHLDTSKRVQNETDLSDSVHVAWRSASLLLLSTPIAHMRRCVFPSQ